MAKDFPGAFSGPAALGRSEAGVFRVSNFGPKKTSEVTSWKLQNRIKRPRWADFDKLFSEGMFFSTVVTFGKIYLYRLKVGLQFFK